MAAPATLAFDQVIGDEQVHHPLGRDPGDTEAFGEFRFGGQPGAVGQGAGEDAPFQQLVKLVVQRNGAIRAQGTEFNRREQLSDPAHRASRLPAWPSASLAFGSQ